MAFDMPIDADRVDDLGLFSFFIRAPIVGTIMWILGGDEAKKQDEIVKQTTDEVVSQEHSVLAPAQLQKMIESNQQKRKGGLKKAPRLVGSDISDFGDCAIQLNAADMEHHFSRSALEDEHDLAKSNKKTSWSDESGQDLVQYIGDDASTMHEPQHSSDSRLMVPSTFAPSQHLPGKSLMKRTRSIRSKDGGAVVDTSRFLPKGLHGGHGGLHMPTKPYADGYVSPDWGWYINTTPPTPEMYHSSSKVYLKKPSTHPAPQATTRRGPSALDSPAFTKGGKGGATHWPSVPI